MSPGNVSSSTASDQLARFIVFLESKERPSDPVSFVRDAAKNAKGKEVEELKEMLHKQPDLELQSCSFSCSTVLSVVFHLLSVLAPLVPVAHYDSIMLLQEIASPPLRNAALRIEVESLDLVVGDLLSLIGRWSSGFQLDDICSPFASYILRPRDAAAPHCKADSCVVGLGNLVVAWTEDDKLRVPFSTTISVTSQ